MTKEQFLKLHNGEFELVQCFLEDFAIYLKDNEPTATRTIDLLEEVAFSIPSNESEL